MIIRDWKKDLFTIPNALSIFRILLIPVYVVIFLNATAFSEGLAEKKDIDRIYQIL